MANSLIESWKNSCQLFSKAQAKMFILATLNGVVRTFRSENGFIAMLAMLFMCSIITVNRGLSSILWDRVFSFFSVKSALGVKIFVGAQQGSSGFFGALFTFTIALVVFLRPSLERKDSRHLLLSIFKYIPFFLVAQEIILFFPCFAYLFMDMRNNVDSFGRALIGSLFLFLYQLPVMLVIIPSYAFLLMMGKYIVKVLFYLKFPPFLSGALIPLAWFIVVTMLFFSACCVVYTKVKHTNRELLFGKQ